MNCSLVNCRLCMGSEEPEIAGGGGKGAELYQSEIWVLHKECRQRRRGGGWGK